MLTHDFDISVLGGVETIQQLALTVFLLILVYVLINEVLCYNQQIPGLAIPPVLPLVGNLHQLRTNAAQQYREWAKDLGPVYQVRLGSIPVMVINSAATAKVILGHNSQATASRPQLYTYHKVCSMTA
ncbi:Nuclease (SNase-like) OB-fold [Penicillium expansum]|nr:Nuclease (SNase-like) OB-fold [Penicillium expansum]